MRDATKALSKYANPFSKRVQELSQKLDKVTISRDIAKLEKLLGEAENMLDNENSASQASIYYSIGTAYSNFSELRGVSGEASIKKQLYCFRKSIGLIETNEYAGKKYRPYVLGFKQVLYTNYANLLNRCGRKIAAIEQYKKATSINRNFGMANGNLGRAYQHYGMLEYDDGHKDLFHYFAYHYLNRALQSDDPNTYSEAKDGFKVAINRYYPEYIEKVLKPDLRFPQYSYEDPEELNYRKWCLSKGLFLNTLNDLPITELCFAGDVIQLPPMIANGNTKPVFHGMFSQLKQEYIYARYIYYSTLRFATEPHFADKETYIKSYTDYAQYSMRLEKLKTAFKTLYGLFDKLAFFLAHYFDMGIKERDISFRSIWQSSAGHGSGKYQFKNTLDPVKNFALSSLYWISKDFFDQYENSPNPELKRIKEIRDSLEHKYVKINDSFIDENIEKYGDGLALYVSDKELYEVTMTLLKILREAIISLSLCVNIAEIPKREATKNKIVIPMYLIGYEDDWKT